MSPSHSQAQSPQFQFYKILYLATSTDGNQSVGVTKSLVAVSFSRPYHLHLLVLILTLTTCGILCSGQSQCWMEQAHDSRLTGFISLLLRSLENDKYYCLQPQHCLHQIVKYLQWYHDKNEQRQKRRRMFQRFLMQPLKNSCFLEKDP